ncbi:MAG: hypothetical protein R2729_28710 [Bryobacteraceae bacterium]
MSQFDPAATDGLTGRQGGLTHPTSGLNRRDSNNFNPRLGFAWHPKQNGCSAAASISTPST